MTELLDIPTPRLDDTSDTPRFRQIQHHMRGLIASRRIKPGQRLPALRPWAAEVGVAYETMSKAIRGLVTEGILEAAPRRGTTVAHRPRVDRPQASAVGIITATPQRRLMQISPYFRAVTPGIHDAILRQHDRVIHEIWSPEASLLQMFGRLNLVDGVLILMHGGTRVPPDQIELVEREHVPIVCVGGGGEEARLYSVHTDDVADCREAVRRLVARGHRRIAAYVREEDQRLEGYLKGLQDAGLAPAAGLIFCEIDTQHVARRIAESRDPPTAMLVARHLQQLPGLIEGLRRRGIQVGRDLYLSVYDDDLWNHVAPLGIAYTCISQPIDQVAQDAVRVLFDRIAGKTPRRTTLLRSRIVDVPARPSPAIGIAP